MFDNNSPQSTENNSDFKKIAVKYLIPGLGVIALLSIVFAGSLYVAKYHPNVLGLSSDIPQNQTMSTEDIEKLVNKVSELILLPPGETPNVATVNDLTQVQSQDFFKNAKVGDKVLIYTASRKAYLYRPDAHKLIEVGIVDQGNPNQAVGGAQDAVPDVISPTPLPTVEPLEELLPTNEPEASPTPTLTEQDPTSPSPTPVTFQ